MNASHDSLWRTLGASVRGDQHIRFGLPNQDAMGWWPESGKGQEVIVAVSDGHGSAKSFRSSTGARLAILSAQTILQSVLTSIEDLANLAGIKRVAEDRIPKEIVQEWRNHVASHLTENPFTDDEFALLEEATGQTSRQFIEQNPPLAYGATLLCALLTERFVLFVQIGDGDILCVDSLGQTSRPFPKDPRMLANETTSLCMADAWREFEVRLMPLVDEQLGLSMLLLSTDGYANSFRSEADFLKIGPDYLEMLRARSDWSIQTELAAILEDASHRGSGDDITMCIVKRREDTDLEIFQEELRRRQADSDQQLNGLQASLAAMVSDIARMASQVELEELRQDLDQDKKELLATIDQLSGAVQEVIVRQQKLLQRLIWGLRLLCVGLVLIGVGVAAFAIGTSSRLADAMPAAKSTVAPPTYAPQLGVGGIPTAQRWLPTPSPATDPVSMTDTVSVVAPLSVDSGVALTTAISSQTSTPVIAETIGALQITPFLSPTLRATEVFGELAPNAVSTQTGQTYIVALGDSLTSIADRFGVTVAALRQGNNLATDTIVVGQELTIPTDHE